jgi:hypothetical protein
VCVCVSLSLWLAALQPALALKVELAGLGLSLVSAHARELAYVSVLGIEASLVDADIDQCVEVKIDRYVCVCVMRASCSASSLRVLTRALSLTHSLYDSFQIDNQLPRAEYPLLLHQPPVKTTPSPTPLSPGAAAASGTHTER